MATIGSNGSSMSLRAPGDDEQPQRTEQIERRVPGSPSNASISSKRAERRQTNSASRHGSRPDSRRNSNVPSPANSQPTTPRSPEPESKGKVAAMVLGDHDPIITHCKKGNVKELKELLKSMNALEREATVNGKDKNGSPPIMHTVWDARLGCLETLLSYGANPCAHNLRENTALHLACEQGREEHLPCIQILIQHGADINAVNWKKETPVETQKDVAVRERLVELMTKWKAEYEEKKMMALNANIDAMARARYKQIFDTIDSDDNGVVTLDELLPLFDTMLIGKPDEGAVKRFFEWFDAERSGNIDFTSFLMGINEAHEIQRKKAEKEAAKAKKRAAARKKKEAAAAAAGGP